MISAPLFISSRVFFTFLSLRSCPAILATFPAKLLSAILTSRMMFLARVSVSIPSSPVITTFPVYAAMLMLSIAFTSCSLERRL